MERNPKALPQFYEFIAQNNIPSTSQVNQFQYEEFFRDLIEKNNKDILHIVFSSGLSGSYNQAVEASKTINAEFPNHKVEVIDSLAASSGYGLLVDEAADLWEGGMTFSDLSKWVYDNRNKLHHQFFSTELKYLRRTGRISGPTATVATALRICPIMKINNQGKIIAYDKAFGKKRAVEKSLDTMEKNAVDGKNYSGKVFISHSNTLKDAEKVAAEIKKKFPNVKDVRLFNIGTIIAAQTGPGTIAIFFNGNERTK